MVHLLHGPLSFTENNQCRQIRCEVRIRLTHRKSICIPVSSASTASVSLLIPLYCLPVSFLPTTHLSDSDCYIFSYLLALCRVSLTTSLSFSISISMCLCLSSDTASTQINYLKAHLILLHTHTRMHARTHTPCTHTLCNGSLTLS